ncbi:hypothetical protein ACFOKI_05620 [Sphingomonas qilianensis]|uniref:Uncharacterized protein n=1 Tax=Sphingomonas qilianensis TaxID=1736690 RepID=A0ABU9XU10_9SPHN
MTGISGQGVVLGIAMARGAGVPKAATRAGLMMGLGGVTPIGAVLATNTIRAAKRAQADKDGDGKDSDDKGNNGTITGALPPPANGQASRASANPGSLPVATTKDVQAAVAPLKSQLERDSAALTKAINDLAAQDKVQVASLNQSIHNLSQSVERLVKNQPKERA